MQKACGLGPTVLPAEGFEQMCRELEMCVASPVATRSCESELLKRSFQRSGDHGLGRRKAAAPSFLGALTFQLWWLPGRSQGVEVGPQCSRRSAALGSAAGFHALRVESQARAAAVLAACARTSGDDAFDERGLLLAGVIEADGKAD